MTDHLETLFDELSPLSLALSAEQRSLLLRHLELMFETNKQFNLTRITEPREAIVKHILDSLLPAKLFADAQVILDLGSGAGYPGIPLAVLFPEKKILLVESTQKKARFLQEVVKELALENVAVRAERAEQVLKTLPPKQVEILTARAVGSIEKLLTLLKPVRNRFGSLLLYKGQRAEEEMLAAEDVATKLKLAGSIVERYALPKEMGEHCIVEYRPM